MIKKRSFIFWLYEIHNHVTELRKFCVWKHSSFVTWLDTLFMSDLCQLVISLKIVRVWRWDQIRRLCYDVKKHLKRCLWSREHSQIKATKTITRMRQNECLILDFSWYLYDDVEWFTIFSIQSLYLLALTTRWHQDKNSTQLKSWRCSLQQESEVLLLIISD